MAIEIDNNKIIDKLIIPRLRLVGEFIAGTAKGNISGHNGEALKAVDTGNLMNSIGFKVDRKDQSVTIGTNVEYAHFVEFGTSKMRPRPFLRTALVEHKADILKILGSEG